MVGSGCYFHWFFPDVHPYILELQEHGFQFFLYDLCREVGYIQIDSPVFSAPSFRYLVVDSPGYHVPCGQLST